MSEGGRALGRIAFPRPGPVDDPDVEQIDESCHHQGHLLVGHAFARATPRTQAEGREGAAGQRHGVNTSKSAVVCLLVGIDDPSLRDVFERPRVVRFVVLDRVDGHADIDAGRVRDPVHDDAAGEHLPREDAAHAGRHAHRLVDAGPQILALRQSAASADLLDVLESRSDLGRQLLPAGRVVEEVEDGTGDAGGRGIGCFVFVSP